MELSKIKQRLEILWQEVEKLEKETPSPGPGGTTDYDELSNKPQIEGTTLSGNKTAAQLGLATSSSVSSITSRFEDLITPDNITVEDNDELPSSIDSRLALHQPISLNHTVYYFYDESGVDYNYFAVDISGAYPKLSYAQIFKENNRVHFYDFITETVPTSGSDNFITSGGVYTSQAAQDTLITGLTNKLSLTEIKNTSVFTYIDSLEVGAHWFYNEANQSVSDTPENLNTTVYYFVYKSSNNTIEVVAYLPSINYFNKFYTCSKTSGTWHAWLGFDNVYGYGRTLASGTDLNTITTPGKYTTNSTSTANSLVNKPPYDTPGAKVSMYEVEPFSSTGLIQKCFVFKSGTGADRGTPEMYVRTGTYANNVWTWYTWYSVGLTIAT